MGGRDQSQVKNEKFENFKFVPIEMYQKVITMTLTVIVMTFWYVFWNRLIIFFFLNFLNFHLGLITTPYVSYVHMTYVLFFT